MTPYAEPKLDVTPASFTTPCQVLWLADNSISTIEGLENLSKLKDLSLARNDITHLRDSLAKNIALQTLNLADNPIGSFKARIFSLREPRPPVMNRHCIMV